MSTNSRNSQEKVETPLTALCDVVFLLIMFFVVTANLEADAHDESVELAKAHNLEKMTTQSTGMIKVSIVAAKNAEGYDIKYAGMIYTREKILGMLKAMVKQDGTNLELNIRCDKKCKLDALEAVTTLASEAGIAKIKISAEVK